MIMAEDKKHSVTLTKRERREMNARSHTVITRSYYTLRGSDEITPLRVTIALFAHRRFDCGELTTC